MYKQIKFSKFSKYDDWQFRNATCRKIANLKENKKPNKHKKIKENRKP